MEVNGPGRYKLGQGRIPGSGYVERCYCLALLLGEMRSEKRFEGGQSKRISWHCEGVLSVSQQWH